MQNYESIQRCILFPFKYYKLLKIVDVSENLWLSLKITKLFNDVF